MLVKSKRNKRFTKNKIEEARGKIRGLFYYLLVELNRDNRNAKPHEFTGLFNDCLEKLKLQCEDAKKGFVYEEGQPSFSLPDAVGWAYSTFAMFDGLTSDTDFMKVMEEKANAVLN